jgi:hypothetical protein
MARKLLAGMAVVVALGAVGPAAGDQLPILRSAKIVHRHPVLKISAVDVRPTEFSAAKRRAVDAEGALLRKNVRLQEAIQLPASESGVVRWRSAKALRPGTWFVQVTAVETGGVTGCPPKMTKCGVHYSNVRRVVVPRSS